MRFLCALDTGTRELRAVCSNVGVSGLYVRVTPEAARDAALESGGGVSVSFRLPTDRAVLTSRTTIAWIDPDDRDAAGRPSIGLGLRLEETGIETKKKIGAFIETFRYAVLVADRDPATVEHLARLLDNDYRVLTASSSVEAIETLESSEVAVIIADEHMHAMRPPTTSHALQITLSTNPDSRRVNDLEPPLGRVFQVLRRPAEDSTLLLALRRAVDAYSLGIENERLSEELERANHRLMRENRFLRRRLEGLRGFEAIVGNSVALTRALAELERIRHSDAAVHIRGEPGTGKELVARALHLGGGRTNHPFVAQNRANLAESFRAAIGGTLFLDEVADLSNSAQLALLSALQQRELDVRIISATQKDLRAEVEAGRFREDLYFRLVVFAVTLPPLRERNGDIPLLAHHFLELLCEKYGKSVPGFTQHSLLALESHSWPGNVRELENEIERVVVLCEPGERVPIEHLSPRLVNGHGFVIPEHLGYDEALRVAQIEMIERALEKSGGLVSRAADSLGIERSRLVKLRQRLGLA